MTVVAELIAELGLDVDQGSFAAGQKGLDGLNKLALSLAGVVDQLGAKLNGLGAKVAVPKAAALGPQLGPALPTDYNKALENEKAAILRSRDAAKLHEQALVSLDGKAEHAAHGGLFSMAHAAEKLVTSFLAFEAVREVTHFAHQMMELASSTEHAATRLGITTKEVQALRYAAKSFDIEAGALDIGMKGLQVSSTAAAHGSKEAAAAYKILGVSVRDANGNAKGTTELFTEIAGGIAGIEDPAQRTAAAVKIFGRAGNELIPLLASGSEGVARLTAEAEALGGGLSEHGVHAAAELEQQVKRLDFAMLGLKSSIGVFVLPVLSRLAEGARVVVSGLQNMWGHAKALQIALGAGLAFAAYKAVAALLAVSAAQWSVVAAQLASTAIFLAWGAVIAGVILVVEDLYQLFTGGKSQIGLWIDEWLGIGTVDSLVRSWAVGIDTLAESLRGLMDVASAAAKIVGLGVMGVDTGAAKKQLRSGATAAGAGFSGAGDTYADAQLRGYGFEPTATASGRGTGAAAVFDQGTPRSVARGMRAALAQGSAGFGQASRSSVNGGGPIDASVNVHVDAHGADPKEIAKHIAREVKKGHTDVARKLRAAHVAAPEPI